MNKIIRIISLIFLILMFFYPMTSEVRADTFTGSDSIISQGNDWIRKGKDAGIVKEEDVSKIVLPIGQFLVGLGAIILVIVTIVMGIKYMASSDARAQADIKQRLIWVVVAAVVIFGAYTIWTITYNFMADVTNLN